MYIKQIITITAVLFCVQCVAGHPAEQPDSLARELNEIIVTSDAPATRLEGSTFVTTVPGTPLQNLGTCLDVLQQLPMIKVVDEAVTVVGKGSPEIFIDGRPMHDGNELLRLQSANISKVELLMAPGALYGSDTAAVLKITTRRRFIDGLSVVERAEATMRRRLSANDMLDLNYHASHFDVFTSGSVARNNSMIKGYTTNTLEYRGQPTVVGSSQCNTYPGVNGSAKAGFNYTADNGLAVGAYYRFNPERADFHNHGSEWLNAEPPVSRDISNHIRAHSHLVSAYCDKSFDGGANVHFDGDFRSAHNSGSVSTTYPDNDYMPVNSFDKRRSTLWAGKLFVGLPLWRGTFTFGTQDSYTRSTLDYRMLNVEVGQYIPSSSTLASQASAAVFAGWQRTFGTLNFSAGLRYEYVDYNFAADGTKDSDLSRRHNLLTPDVSIGWSPREDTQLSLSYKAATVRPPYSQLTGSLSYVGRHEIEGGNAALRDERMHDVQIFGVWKDFMLQADYTRSLDTYGFVKRVYPASTLQLLLQPVNINVSAVDAYLVWEYKVGAWSPSVTAGMHKQWLEYEGARYDRPIFSYYFDNTVSLPCGFLATLNASGSSSGYMHTNRFGSTWFTLDASVSRHFLGKSLQVKLSATDIFNTANSDWTMNTCGVLVEKHQSYDRRGLSLTLTYRFQPRPSAYKGSAASASEMQRL